MPPTICFWEILNANRIVLSKPHILWWSEFQHGKEWCSRNQLWRALRTSLCLVLRHWPWVPNDYVVVLMSASGRRTAAHSRGWIQKKLMHGCSAPFWIHIRSEMMSQSCPGGSR